ncbi:MAG: UxaA family hydrolase [Verrucomicrobiota bacterium]
MTSEAETPVKAFVIDRRDNTATALESIRKGERILFVGDSNMKCLIAIEDIRAEHKLALRPISKDSAVVKYGMPIGHATRPIAAGEWIHLHNCGSNYDERSNHLDTESGAPSDIDYV